MGLVTLPFFYPVLPSANTAAADTAQATVEIASFTALLELHGGTLGPNISTSV